MDWHWLAWFEEEEWNWMERRFALAGLNVELGLLGLVWKVRLASFGMEWIGTASTPDWTEKTERGAKPGGSLGVDWGGRTPADIQSPTLAKHPAFLRPFAGVWPRLALLLCLTRPSATQSGMAGLGRSNDFQFLPFSFLFFSFLFSVRSFSVSYFEFPL